MDATAKAVTAAKLLGDVTVLCAGASAPAAGAEAATIDGVPRFWSPKMRRLAIALRNRRRR